MSQTDPRSSGGAGRASSRARHEQPTPAAEVPERPALAPEVQLVGEMPETGFTERQWLVKRGDRFVQITELLYRVVEQMDGERTLEEIAERATESTEWLVSAANVRQLIQLKLIPAGLVTPAGGVTSGKAPSRDRTPSPLALNMRLRTIGPRVIDPITKVLQFLYAPPVLIPVLIAIVIAHGWLYFVHGVVGSVLEVLYTPGLLLVVLAIVLVSGIFHEFGHASALRYGGGQVRGMGVGYRVPVLRSRARAGEDDLELEQAHTDTPRSRGADRRRRRCRRGVSVVSEPAVSKQGRAGRCPELRGREERPRTDTGLLHAGPSGRRESCAPYGRTAGSTKSPSPTRTPYTPSSMVPCGSPTGPICPKNRSTRCAGWPNARTTCSRALTPAYPRRSWSRRGAASCASTAPMILASISSCAPFVLVPKRQSVEGLAREEQVRRSSTTGLLYLERSPSVTIPPFPPSKY